VPKAGECLFTGVDARAGRELVKEWSACEEVAERCAATRDDLRGEYGS
jgi:hypothetical protein